MPKTNLTVLDQFHPRDIKALAGLTYRQLQVWDVAKALPKGQTKPKKWRAFTPADTVVILVLRTIQQSLGIELEPLGRIQSELSRKMHRTRFDQLNGMVVITDLGKELTVAERSQALKWASKVLENSRDAKSLVAVNLAPLVRQVEEYNPPPLTRKRRR